MSGAEIALYLKAEDIDGDTEVEFVSEGEYTKLTQKDNTTKDVFNIDVLLPSGERRTWSPNRKSQEYLARKYGTKSIQWFHKKAMLMKIKQSVMGNMKDVIYVKGSV